MLAVFAVDRFEEQFWCQLPQVPVFALASMFPKTDVFGTAEKSNLAAKNHRLAGFES
jgi:hypothetical protein